MKLAEFIRSYSEAILQEWEQFARSIQPKKLGKKALPNHTELLLKDIADDLDTQQTKHEQAKKTKSPVLKSAMTSVAGSHYLERFQSGFGITDVIAEYRFMRARRSLRQI